MASQSLYRKWRSQTFAELIGQEHVVQTLRNAIIEERVAHAYLFTGPRGVGKTTMARLLAKAVNCTDPNPAARPCGQCPACVAIAEGRAVDVIEMDAASHTSVEDAREIIERVQFRPAEMRSKVYIIDETHMLSTAAFNALLKTLEEPPDHAIFILATTEVHKVPATILSRCQRFTFTRHGIAATSNHLRQIASAEGLSLEAGVPEAIARAATGSMRDALGVLEQLASFGQGMITLEQVHSLLGMTAAAEVHALIEALLDADVGAALRAVNGVSEQGADVRQFTRDVVERLRTLLLFRATNDRSLLDVGEDELRNLEVWAQRAEPGDLVEWIKLLSGLDYQLRTTPYGHLPLELAVVEALVAPKRPEVSVAPRPSPKRSEPARRPEPSAAAPEPPRQREPDPPPEIVIETVIMPVAPEVLDQAAPPPRAARGLSASPEEFQAANADMSLLERIEAEWDEIKRNVRPHSPTVQALLNSIRPIDVEGNTIVLLASSPFHKDNLERASNTKLVEQVINKQLGGNFAIRCTIETKPEARDIRGQIRHARNDEHVRAALNIFEARIVDIEEETD
ncbi:DNA polymerase III, subunits gamma and tau [Oscillochloris trichoides DG-6]|uniref:DNA polymerase III subunit gamma/tau n=1 Tax=Oscillochloris trichoides DG-6 TaxID=765420 RepID=E1IBX4_9CHLR|nr:DNA polymerase III subunit gamma/tau [Oscillochloris trichoides]EFO81302.1 DNA polymerase III, subunits gamma and tau [Oscillochloris trichoides DG-6]